MKVLRHFFPCLSLVFIPKLPQLRNPLFCFYPLFATIHAFRRRPNKTRTQQEQNKLLNWIKTRLWKEKVINIDGINMKFSSVHECNLYFAHVICLVKRFGHTCWIPFSVSCYPTLFAKSQGIIVEWRWQIGIKTQTPLSSKFNLLQAFVRCFFVPYQISSSPKKLNIWIWFEIIILPIAEIESVSIPFNLLICSLKLIFLPSIFAFVWVGNSTHS